MQTPRSSQLLLAIALVSLMFPIWAASETNEKGASGLSEATACHVLMTEQECDQHKSALAQLAPGPARERYLAEHLATKLEREAACSCNRKVLANTFRPVRRQAMLHY